jgi:heat shock protein HslJ/uncharacterized membrane protein
MLLKNFAIYLLLLNLIRFSLPVSAQSGSLHEIAGLYAGTIPCADCPGIQFKISLLRNGTYEESALYIDRSTTPITSGGNYTIEDQSIVKLGGNPYSMGLFRILPSGLQMLDAGGNEITGALADRYVLTKLTRSMKNQQTNQDDIITAPLNRKKYHQGITFYATGNEPSWSLDIAAGKSIHFKTLEGQDMKTPFAEGIKAMDQNITLFNLQTETGTLRIQIQQEECIDNMSGIRHPFRVIIDVRNNNENETRHYEGCGTYVPDYGLEGKWTLKKTGTVEADEKEYQRGLPFLEINVDSSSYSGFAGCNRFMGKISSIERGLIRINDGAITMMACPDMEGEQAFLSALRITTHYKIADGELVLSNPDKTILVLKQTPSSVPIGYRVIDLWVLESINGKKADLKNYPKELPRIEINSQMKLMGNAGCNNINGTVEADEKTIKITAMMMTRMACPAAAEETEFVNALQGANSYQVQNNRLSLMKDGQTTLVFRKTD